ncbi:hypothetical protein C0J52_10676 [Blattella germanica]|nr:hypothetical protein C0J52_10676 [Blattella germanica]
MKLPTYTGSRLTCCTEFSAREMQILANFMVKFPSFHTAAIPNYLISRRREDKSAILGLCKTWRYKNGKTRRETDWHNKSRKLHQQDLRKRISCSNPFEVHLLLSGITWHNPQLFQGCRIIRN